MEMKVFTQVSISLNFHGIKVMLINNSQYINFIVSYFVGGQIEMSEACERRLQSRLNVFNCGIFTGFTAVDFSKIKAESCCSCCAKTTLRIE
jgi:hypothetical protein